MFLNSQCIPVFVKNRKSCGSYIFVKIQKMEEEFLSEICEDSLSDVAENDSEDSDIVPVRRRVALLRVLSSSSSSEEDIQ